MSKKHVPCYWFREILDVDEPYDNVVPVCILCNMYPKSKVFPLLFSQFFSGVVCWFLFFCLLLDLTSLISGPSVWRCSSTRVHFYVRPAQCALMGCRVFSVHWIWCMPLRRWIEYSWIWWIPLRWHNGRNVCLGVCCFRRSLGIDLVCVSFLWCIF